jgi:mRNA interferase RelE/StbE
MYQILIKPKAKKQLQRLPTKDQKRVAAAIDQLSGNPLYGKQLNGELHGLYSIRVWPYRIIYTVQHKTITVTVVAIGHRKDVYEKL